LNETGEDALLNILDERESYVLRDFIGKELRLVLSYISAINVLYVNMGAIAAVLNGRDIITHEEIEQVDPYVRLYWKSVVMDILSRIQNRSLEDIRKSIYTMLGNKENKEGLSEKELKNTVKIKLKCSSRSVNKVVDDMKKNKELLTKKDFVKLNSKR
jgi:predicted ribosome-associated RNA-binding protein Tma20